MSMRMDRAAVSKLADRRLDAAAHERDRYVDLAIEFVDEASGEVLGEFGGRWDRTEKRYADEDSRERLVKTLHVGQLDAARWFDEWLANYQAARAGDVEAKARGVYDAIYYGGRRSGKSDFGFACAVAFALAEPGSIVWVVVPTEAFLGEPAMYLESIMPREWYRSIEKPAPAYYLINGSQIIVRSGHVARKLKQGKADFVLVNEGQALIGQSYDTLSASIVDTGGLIMTAANPPDIGDPGDWVADLIAETERGDRVHARAFFFDPLLNPHIDQVALAALAEKYDAHTFDVQIRGLLLSTPDTVLHAWNRMANEKSVPELSECTEEFTKYFEGHEMRDIVSIDVQSFPWIAAIRLRAYRDPMAPNDMEQAFLWGVGESYVEKGDELDTARDLMNLGLIPSRTLTIMDASCFWQQAQRDQTLQRAEFRGKGSSDMMRSAGFRLVVPPDQHMKANPDIVDRVRGANSRIGTKAGHARVFVDPKLCPMTVASIRGWKTRNGKPSRTSKKAHGGDAITYAIWRFFPRRVETTKVEVTKLPPRLGGRDRMKGF